MGKNNEKEQELNTEVLKPKKRRLVKWAVIAVIVLGLGGGFFAWSRKPSSRMLLSSLYFMQSTLNNPSYMLYGIDIMELCTEYGNGDVEINGKLGLSGIEQVNSSLFFEMDALRSFSQKKLSAHSQMRILFLNVGELDFYAEDETVYMLAPLLGDDVNYAFPTGLELFRQMPDFTSDFDREWFKEHLGDIANLTGEIQIEETGDEIIDADGREAEGFDITIPAGCGDFIWELLGMDAPDYDVECTLYLDSMNRIHRIEMDLEHFLPGAYVTVDGMDLGTVYFTYELPDDEHLEATIYRNSDYSRWIDLDATYFANTGKEYNVTCAITWQENEEVNGYTLKVNDLLMTGDGDTLAKGYFKGTMNTVTIEEDLFAEDAEAIYGAEVIDWKEVRDDTEGFVNDLLATTNLLE